MLTRVLPRRGLALALCLAALPGLVQADASARAREEFAAAYAAPVAGATGDSEALSAYPLYPWLLSARLRAGLPVEITTVPVSLAALAAAELPAGEAEALAFVEAASEVAHARDLRRALLARLAARGDHAGFLTLWRESAATDALRCQHLDARRALVAAGDTAALAQEIADRWLKEAALPAECNASFAWLKSQPLYTPALVERRLRARLLDADATRARALLPELPAERRARYEAWLDQLANPATAFARLAEGTPQLLDPEGLADAWMRWSRKSPDEAAALLDAVAAAQKLSKPQTQALQANTALALAWNRDSDALTLFRQVPDELLDERGFEWRVRAALWAGEWNQALNWLALMPEDLAAQPRWRYWNARALEALGQKAEAKLRYTSLTKENDTYGLLAAWRNGKGWKPIDEPQPVTPAQSAALAATPAFVRASEAWRAGFKSIASLEWADALRDVPEGARPALVREAAALGWLDQAIVTSTKLGLFRDLETLFPRPHAALVQQAAADSGIPSAWIYSVMRKESAFNPDARSSAGALGLLQMMPGTALMTAKAAGLPVPSNDALGDPAINIPLGALHLREVLDKSDGRWQMALAAYNAGFRAMNRWRPPATLAPMEADVWIENIPFNETRVYVQRILFHVGVYQWLETKKSVRANNWLPPVEALPVAP